MNEHAGREKEIEARHHACSYLPSAVEICTVCFLLAQLREAREKLAAVKEGLEREIRVVIAATPRGDSDAPFWRGRLGSLLFVRDRILKGGD